MRSNFAGFKSQYGAASNAANMNAAMAAGAGGYGGGGGVDVNGIIGAITGITTGIIGGAVQGSTNRAGVQVAGYQTAAQIAHEKSQSDIAKYQSLAEKYGAEGGKYVQAGMQMAPTNYTPFLIAGGLLLVAGAVFFGMQSRGGARAPAPIY